MENFERHRAGDEGKLSAGRSLVTTVGEGLVVMDPSTTGRLRGVRAFNKRIGGAELNVAVALSRMGRSCRWTGCLGDDEFGHEILSFLSGEGVDISSCTTVSDAPTGLYFKERGPADGLRTYYYRSGSAASGAKWGDFDADTLLDCEILHLTGITPALSETCCDLVYRLVDEAAARDVVISFDANLRFKILGKRDPVSLLDPVLRKASLLFFSAEEARLLLGSSKPEAVKRATARYEASTVVVHDSAGAFMVVDDEVFHRRAYDVRPVDAVGAGDAFVAGFLHGHTSGWGMERILAYASACGACAVSVEGDAESMPFEEDALGLIQAEPREGR